MTRSCEPVAFGQPPDVVFGYLADPRNRPAWQSSLRAVDLQDEGEARVGMRWRDLTGPGPKPQMWITELTPYRVWSERGTWAGITADLTLRFTGTGPGTSSGSLSGTSAGSLSGALSGALSETRVVAEVEVHGAGVWAPVAAVLGRLAPGALVHDLRRASEILAER